jgi:UDP-glucuronate 4-epimerase
MRYVSVLESSLGRKAICDFQPIQPGDVEATWADTSALEEAVSFRPATPVEEGVRRFVEWYLDYYRVEDRRDASSPAERK